MEIITRKISFSHFLLMFGYKLFSLYFPLFLVWKGLSLVQVGYAYLFIYLPLAIFSPVSAFLCSRFKERVLIILGIFGYFLYSLGMLLYSLGKIPNFEMIIFYLFQILLGVSASLFFVGSRSLLISSTKSPDESFSWFYSMPIYADVLAPAVGAVFIWKFGFIGIFILSFIIHFLNIFYSYRVLPKVSSSKEFKNDYSVIFKGIQNIEVAFLLGLAFLVVILGGFYRAFFVLFLKNQLFWSNDKILFFVALVSAVFVPISWKLTKIIGSQKSKINILQGSFIESLVAIALGFGFKFLNFSSLFILELTDGIGGLMVGSGKSGFLARKFKEFPEETGAIDTIFAPLGVAIGSLIGGLLLKSFSFAVIFQWFGIFLFVLTLSIWFITKRK